MPFGDYQRYHRLIKRANRAVKDIDVCGLPEDALTLSHDADESVKEEGKHVGAVAKKLEAILNKD